LANLTDCRAAATRLTETCREQRVCWGLVRSTVVCPTRFNRLVEDTGSKGSVLGQGLADLLLCNCTVDGDEPLHFFIDKHGGRNTYAALIQNALPDSMVLAREEGMERSTYSAVGLGRDICLTFQPRADVEHFCVALASMISKYLREVLML